MKRTRIRGGRLTRLQIVERLRAALRDDWWTRAGDIYGALRFWEAVRDIVRSS